MRNHKMILLIGAIVATSTLAVSAQQAAWSVNENRAGIVTAKAVARQSFPREFKLFNLNIEPLRQRLLSIVDSKAAPRSSIISLPNADGRMEEFEVFEASNFEPELQARFPEIRAYSGRGITDRFATVKLSYSPSKGIGGTIFRTASGPFVTGGETEIIERYSADGTVYAVFRSRRNKGELPWACTTQEDGLFSGWKSQIDQSNVVASNDGQIRVLRLVQSNNGEYAIWHANNATPPTTPSVSIVLEGFNGTLTRSNGVYEKDLGVHLNLIADTTRVIYLDPTTDPYSTSLSAWNNQLRDAVRANFNLDEYDIGHMFGASGGGGNAGCIGCVCSNNPGSAHFGHDKARGITSPADAIPEGDNFDIDYVVHEVGHQIGANHTFSYGQLPIPEDLGQDKEIGSGITIMGYAGITEVDVAPHSIDVFHETSIGQIQANLPTRPCPVGGTIPSANQPPVVAPVSNYTIPITTPFALTGSATDPEGDPLTYNWEQDDSAENTGVTVAASSASPGKAIGPNWVTWPSTTSPTKLFPRLETILAGQFITDSHPNGTDPTIDIEALSSITRDLHFRLTVRDNHPYVAGSSIGQTQFTNMTVSVTNAAGPFKVTAPDTNVTYSGGAPQTVTWTVANTNLAPVGTTNVKISMSTDGGITFPHVLAASTANDGTESVTIPNIATATARMKIEAVGNIFFDISDTNFTIQSPTSANANISGRITDAWGNGVGKAVVSLTAQDGTVRTALTNSFGYYSFPEVPTGQTYVVQPAHKRCTFTPENITYTHVDEVSDLDFAAEGQ